MLYVIVALIISIAINIVLLITILQSDNKKEIQNHFLNINTNYLNKESIIEDSDTYFEDYSQNNIFLNQNNIVCKNINNSFEKEYLNDFKNPIDNDLKLYHTFRHYRKKDEMLNQLLFFYLETYTLKSGNEFLDLDWKDQLTNHPKFINLKKEINIKSPIESKELVDNFFILIYKTSFSDTLGI